MKPYAVYLEINKSGECMAHLPQLPGLLVRAHSREAALARLPAAIRSYRDWLRRHDGPDLVSGEEIAWEVAATLPDLGAFDPSDMAALFDWEYEPLGRDEMEASFQLAAYNRADLLAVVRCLSPSVRRWRASPEQMSIDQIIVHIGNGEQWYISRLVDAKSFPVTRFDQSGMTPLAYLKQTRERVLARFRQLSNRELAATFHPTHNTDNPDEPWTARKAVRRLLEHEREHLDHIQDILGQWRQHLLARIAADRAYLFWQLRGLDEETLSRMSVSGVDSAKSLLAHVAIWDAVQAERISRVLDDRLDQIQPVGGPAEMDRRNAEIQRRYQDLSLEQAVAICLKERGGFLRVLAQLSEEELHRQIRLPWGWRTRPRVWAMWRHRHDADHTGDLLRWRQRLPEQSRRQIGPKYLLRAILQVARKEFLAVAALVPDWQRDSRPVCGVWTLKDLVGHLTDWELVGLNGLQQLVAGHSPEFEAPITDFDRFNDTNAVIRRDQPWPEVWAEFNQTRSSLLQTLDRLSPELMAATFFTPWQTTISAYLWTLIWPGHEREHAIDVRRALQMPQLPRRLRLPH